MTALTSQQAKDTALALAVDQKIKVVWRMKGDPTEYTWKGTVREKKARWVVVTYDVGPEDPTERFDLPISDEEVEYLSIQDNSDGRSSGSMTRSVRQRHNLLEICEWRPATWGHLLHPPQSDHKLETRARLMGSLAEFYSLRPRHSLTVAADDSDYERATAYESLLAWICLAQITPDWNNPVVIGLIEPLIHRLCSMRRGAYFSEKKKRLDAVAAVYKALNHPNAARDRLTEIMLLPVGTASN